MCMNCYCIMSPFSYIDIQTLFTVTNFARHLMFYWRKFFDLLIFIHCWQGIVLHTVTNSTIIKPPSSTFVLIVLIYNLQSYSVLRIIRYVLSSYIVNWQVQISVDLYHYVFFLTHILISANRFLQFTQLD